jgi:hypothetical protein
VRFKIAAWLVLVVLRMSGWKKMMDVVEMFKNVISMPPITCPSSY